MEHTQVDSLWDHAYQRAFGAFDGGDFDSALETIDTNLRDGSLPIQGRIELQLLKAACTVDWCDADGQLFLAKTWWQARRAEPVGFALSDTESALAQFQDAIKIIKKEHDVIRPSPDGEEDGSSSQTEAEIVSPNAAEESVQCPSPPLSGESDDAAQETPSTPTAAVETHPGQGHGLVATPNNSRGQD